eukprot:717994-Rhodomonas_salina.1
MVTSTPSPTASSASRVGVQGFADADSGYGGTRCSMPTQPTRSSASITSYAAIPDYTRLVLARRICLRTRYATPGTDVVGMLLRCLPPRFPLPSTNVVRMLLRNLRMCLLRDAHVSAPTLTLRYLPTLSLYATQARPYPVPVSRMVLRTYYSVPAWLHGALQCA